MIGQRKRNMAQAPGINKQNAFRREVYKRRTKNTNRNSLSVETKFPVFGRRASIRARSIEFGAACGKIINHDERKKERKKKSWWKVARGPTVKTAERKKLARERNESRYADG